MCKIEQGQADVGSVQLCLTTAGICSPVAPASAIFCRAGGAIFFLFNSFYCRLAAPAANRLNRSTWVLDAFDSSEALTSSRHHEQFGSVEMATVEVLLAVAVGVLPLLVFFGGYYYAYQLQSRGNGRANVPQGPTWLLPFWGETLQLLFSDPNTFFTAGHKKYVDIHE